MRIFATLLIAIFVAAAIPAHAASFLCPTPQIIPQTLNYSARPGYRRNIRPVQAYLDNLRRISTRYMQVRSRGQKNELTNCLMDHLVTLADNRSLQFPRTRADGATWFLVHEEVATALAIHQAHLRFKPQMPFINAWLDATPQYGPQSPYTVASIN